MAKTSIDNKAVLLSLVTEGQLFENQLSPEYSSLIVPSARVGSARYLHYRNQCLQEVSQCLPLLSGKLVSQIVLAILNLCVSAFMGAQFHEARTHCIGLAKIFAQPNLFHQCPGHIIRDAIVLDALISIIIQQVPAISFFSMPEGPPPAAYTSLQAQEPKYRFHVSPTATEVVGQRYAEVLEMVASVAIFNDAAKAGKISYRENVTYFKSIAWRFYRW